MLLRRVGGDLSSGKDLDVYVTALIAFAVGVLGVLNVVDTNIVVAATLATLTLVALSALVSRNQVSDLDTSVRELSTLVRGGAGTAASLDQQLTASTSGAGVHIGPAEDIRLVGVTLNRTIRNHVGELERRLAHGASVSVALIDPTSSAPHEAARRCTMPNDPQIFEHRLKPTIDLLQRLASLPHARGRLHVRFLSFVPAFGLTIIDPATADGRIYVDLYSHRPSAAEPVFALGADRDPRWYRHFLQEFDRIWADGRPAGMTDGFAPAPLE